MAQKHNISRSKSYSPQSRTQRIAAKVKTDTKIAPDSSPVLSLKEIAGRENRHVNTIRNWIHVGVKGRTLECEWRGGEGFVSLANLQKFYEGGAK